jgi:hypothetical protein
VPCPSRRGLRSASLRSRLPHTVPLPLPNAMGVANPNEPRRGLRLRGIALVEPRALRPLHRPFQDTARTGSRPSERRCIQPARGKGSLPPHVILGVGGGRSTILFIIIFGLGCRTRLRPARARESGGEYKPLPSRRGRFTGVAPQPRRYDRCRMRGEADRQPRLLVLCPHD